MARRFRARLVTGHSNAGMRVVVGARRKKRGKGRKSQIRVNRKKLEMVRFLAAKEGGSTSKAMSNWGVAAGTVRPKAPPAGPSKKTKGTRKKVKKNASKRTALLSGRKRAGKRS